MRELKRPVAINYHGLILEHVVRVVLFPYMLLEEGKVMDTASGLWRQFFKNILWENGKDLYGYKFRREGGKPTDSYYLEMFIKKISE